MAVHEYKCPCCSGALAFDSTIQKMKCQPAKAIISNFCRIKTDSGTKKRNRQNPYGDPESKKTIAIKNPRRKVGDFCITSWQLPAGSA